MSTSSTLKSLFDMAVTEITKQTEELSDYAFNAPEAAIMVRKATNSDAWGPSGTDMLKISNLTHRHSECRVIMDAVWDRLTKTPPKNWRNVYKALLLLDYLLKNGAERIIGEVRGQIFELKQLQKFQFIDEGDVDRGLSVRERSKQIIDLVHDTERLKEERRLAQQNRSKYSESISSNGSFGGGGSSVYSGHGGGYSGSTAPRRTSYSNKKPAPSGFLESSDDEDPTSMPPPSHKPVSSHATFDDDDDDWGDFDKKVTISKQPVQTTTKAPATQSVGPAPVLAAPPVAQVKPQEVNPLDSLGVDLLGTGTLPTPAEKPLPNLFGGPTQPVVGSGHGNNLPNLFGGPATTVPSGTGNNLPNLFGGPSANTSSTVAGSNLPNLFGGPAATGSGFGPTGTTGFGAPAGFGTTGVATGVGMNPGAGMTGMPAYGMTGVPGYGGYPQQPVYGGWGAYPPAGQ